MGWHLQYHYRLRLFSIRSTIDFVGLWEVIHNAHFNSIEFEVIKNQTGLNGFKISAKEWTERTNAVGLVIKTGRYVGNYAHSDFAFEFGSWISANFKLYFIREF
ncbi:KilA-N domain-containing protein [Pedobacter sp. MC2016-24]|uniref:KilA-N domain-containing protein n=1 Tax=Pedobacter sp. MC2016-24 TaxID=2780090 RepID=UPI00187EDC3C|nr:KilA-N domain-containing protein [Pedobacter sp. MC2016-24]